MSIYSFFSRSADNDALGPRFYGTVREALASPGFFDWDRGTVNLVKYFQAHRGPRGIDTKHKCGTSKSYEHARAGSMSTVVPIRTTVVTFKS